MSDESFQDRSEAPTPKKRRDAHKKGQVPRSQELNAAILLLASGFLLQGGAPLIARSLASLFRHSVQQVMTPAAGIQGTIAWLGEAGWLGLSAIAPLALTMAGVAAVMGGIQARGVMSLEPLKPQWSRMSPQKNAKRIWGVKAPVELAKNLFKLSVILGVVYLVLSGAWNELPSLSQQSPLALLLFIQSKAAKLLIGAGLAYLLIGLADYGYQVWDHERSLKMTKEEIKREVKESEGDQIVRVRRRTMARSLARRRMLLSVSDADVVVTNPTHIAVALKYDPSVAHAPIILAMGVRKVARQIRELAVKADVPVVENKPLARALWSTGRIGFPIPEELYLAVAEILAFIMSQRARAKKAWQGSSII